MHSAGGELNDLGSEPVALRAVMFIIETIDHRGSPRPLPLAGDGPGERTERDRPISGRGEICYDAATSDSHPSGAQTLLIACAAIAESALRA